MQQLVPDPRANYRNVADAMYRIVRYEGVRNPVRGISAVVGGAGPAHALYFATYEKLKKTLSNKPGGHGSPLTQGRCIVINYIMYILCMDIIYMGHQS